MKVLVDLALGRASGQGDWEVERVKFFRDAVTGFMSLIYDVKPSDGFHELIVHCKTIWKALETDQQLPTKLVSNSFNSI